MRRIGKRRGTANQGPLTSARLSFDILIMADSHMAFRFVQSALCATAFGGLAPAGFPLANRTALSG